MTVFKKNFAQRTWEDRKEGDPDFFYYSESKFEEHWPGPAAHFGLGAETEGMATWKMGPFMSHAPDYIAALGADTTPLLVEIQGTGTGGAIDGIISHKFKQKKLDALGKWNSHSEVTFWLWNDADDTHIWTSYVSIRGMIGSGKAIRGEFDGFRTYWAIPVEVIQEHADTERLMERYG